jgi:hypothetical protein
LLQTANNFNEQHRSVVWAKELGLFVSVYRYDTTVRILPVLISPDGIIWRSLSGTVGRAYWNSVVWSPERNLLVAVAKEVFGDNTNRVITSSDGITWTPRDVAIDLNSVVWSPERNLFVAVGLRTAIRSTNGIDWTTSVADIDNYEWRSITYSPTLNRFVAVAYNSGSSFSSIISDDNGVTWTNGNLSNRSWNGVAFGGSIFVAVSDDRIFSSTNGITWTSRNTSTYGLESVVFGNNIFVAVGYISNINISYAVVLDNTGSLMGVFESSGNNNLNGRWGSVTFGNGLFVAVGILVSGRRVMTSPDGLNWTSRTTPLDCDLTWTSVTFGNGSFVAVSNNGSTGRVMRSIDGINWTLIPTSSSINSIPWNSITFGNGIFVAVSSTGPTRGIMFSVDGGVNWVVQTGTFFRARSVTFGNDTFVAMGINASLTSANGSDWISHSLNPISADWLSVTWAAELGLFVAVARSGTNQVMTSSDGITWTRRSTPISVVWTSVVWSPELRLLVAVGWSGSTGYGMTSPDGINWTSRTVPSRNWQSVTWARELGLFIAVADTGSGQRMMTSPDGINWSLRTTPADNSWTSVTWSPELGRVVAVADGGGNNTRGMYSRQLQRVSSRIEGSQEVSEDMIVRRNINIGQAFMPPPEGNAPLYSVRAWILFEGSFGFIRKSKNISSVERLGTGRYRVFFRDRMPSDNYVVLISTSRNATNTFYNASAGGWSEGDDRAYLWSTHTGDNAARDLEYMSAAFIA